MGFSQGGLWKKRCQVRFFKFPLGDLCRRSRDLAQRSCQETSYRDLVHTTCEENRDLAQRSFIGSLNGDLTLRSLAKRSLIEILSRRSCPDTSHRDLRRDLYRDLALRSLTEILPTELL